MSLNNLGQKGSETYLKGGSLACVSHVKGSPSSDRRPGSASQKSQTHSVGTGTVVDAQRTHRLGSASSIQSRSSPKTDRQSITSARKTPNILPVGQLSIERRSRKSVGAVTDSVRCAHLIPV